MNRDIIRAALVAYKELADHMQDEVCPSYREDADRAAEALRLFDEQAVPRLRANDSLSLADLGNEIHNASCTVVHLNEKIGARLGEIAVQLWYWKEQAAPVEHELNDLRCACCGYMTYHREHMGCIRAAAPKMEGKAIVPVEPTKEMLDAAEQVEWMNGSGLLLPWVVAPNIYKAMLAAAQKEGSDGRV